MAATRLRLIEIIDETIEKNKTVVSMKLDISSLKADVSVLKSDVAGLKSDVTVLKSDVAVLKSDVAVLKSDVAVLKSDVTGLKHEFSSFKEQMHHFGLIQEEMRDSLKALAEAVTPLLKKSADMSEFDQTLHDQGDQIKITQTALKNHINNKSVHNPPR